jgi:hypothetical protein
MNKTDKSLTKLIKKIKRKTQLITAIKENVVIPPIEKEIIKKYYIQILHESLCQ